MSPLNPLLESDGVECAHKGKVLLQSSTKDLMCVENAGMISLQDLANATIVGCANNIAGIPSPCTKLVNIPNSIISTLLEIDNQKIILAQAISQVLTDKGSPLILQGEPKAKDIFEIDEDIVENVQNTQNNNAKSTSESSGDSNESNAESNAKSSKDSSDSQSTQDSQSNADENKKSEIDLRGQTTPNGGKVEWISQYNSKVHKAGDTARERACEYIMSQLGIKVENPSNKKVTYQVAIEKDMKYNNKSKT